VYDASHSQPECIIPLAVHHAMVWTDENSQAAQGKEEDEDSAEERTMNNPSFLV
jgi:hypothetical protein